eukprot:1009574-Rhodomonas_salina.1
MEAGAFTSEDGSVETLAVLHELLTDVLRSLAGRCFGALSSGSIGASQICACCRFDVWVDDAPLPCAKATTEASCLNGAWVVLQESSSTPVFIAAQEGHYECLKILVAAKANIDHVANVRMPAWKDAKSWSPCPCNVSGTDRKAWW